MNIIAIPLGWIMKGCYYVCKNYGIALLLFTFITRIIVFPLNVKQQKSSARMSMIKPKLDELQKKYTKDQNKLQEEQMKLYAEANVNPMASCLPMIITMVILFALIPVIYGPLTYVSSGIDKDDITRNNNLISNLAVVSQEVQSNETTVAALLEEHADAEDPYEELKTLFTDEEQYPNSAKQLSKNGGVDDVIAAIKLHNDIDTFITDDSYFSQNLIKSRPELMTFVFCQDAGGKYSDVMYIVDDKIGDFATDFNYSIFGIYMGTIPTWKNLTVIVPVLCFVLQLLVTIVSQYFMKKNNPDMAKMSGGMNIMLYIMPFFSLWLAFSYPLGLGLYWSYSSIFSLAQTIILNKIYTPEHVAELVERDIAKEKASGKPSMMQKMAEAQLIAAGKDPSEIRRDTLGDDAEEEPKKKSKAELKEEQRRRIAEKRQAMEDKYDEDLEGLSDEQRDKLQAARRRMAEKYGDDFND